MPEEPGNKHDEQVAVRHADASGGYIMEKISTKRTERETSTLAKDDQKQQEKNNRTNGGRQYDVSKKLRVHQRLPTHLLLWNILRVMRHQVGWGPYLCRSLVMFMTTYIFLPWRCVLRDGWMKESLHRRRVGMVEDARDLKRSELNELVENLTCLQRP